MLVNASQSETLTHISNPAEDVGVEANVVLRDVEASLNQDFALKGATIICQQPINRE